MHSGNFKKIIFQRFGGNQTQQNLSSGVESQLYAFGEQSLYTRVLTNFCFKSYRRNPSVPKTLKIIVLLSFNKEIFYQMLVASGEIFQFPVE